MICFCCHRNVHRERDCRIMEKEKGMKGGERCRQKWLPCRRWCFSCVAGRGADDPHRKSSGVHWASEELLW